jgi:DNA (cytosine-5)-methyltransferase 1
MKFLSTFTGIGGFELGIRAAWEMNPIGEEPEFIGFSEIDKFASSVYCHHFKGVKNYGDITKINADELPEFDCLVGGFPCQAFSIAGKRGGFNDTRGTLFFDLARILKAKRPRLFVFENVKGLLSHDGGRTIDTIIRTIDELGYDCQWQVLNSKNHGVPQNRERIVIVGHLRGTPRPKVFPFLEDGEATNEPSGEEPQTSPTIDASYYKQHSDGIYIKQINQPIHSNDRVYDAEGISPTLNTMQGGNRQPFIATRADGMEVEMDVANTVTSDAYLTSGKRGVVDGKRKLTSMYERRIRRLTPIECERLQGFPDNWTKYGLGGVLISDSQRYKMAGNAVTTNVFRDVFARILDVPAN